MGTSQIRHLLGAIEGKSLGVLEGWLETDGKKLGISLGVTVGIFEGLDEMDG